MAERRLIQHTRSRVVENGKAKLPTSLEPGEIAINYANDHETISIQNDNGEIITFHPSEVQVGGSGDTILESTSVYIDTDGDSTIEIYTKDDVDSVVSGINAAIQENVIIGTETPTSVNTDLFVDTTTDGDPYNVYTKEQVDAIVADLQRQIDELKG